MDSRFYRDASGRLTFELSTLPAEEYGRVSRALASVLHLRAVGRIVESVDVVFQDYQRDEATIGLEWDNWTGFTVVAKDPAAESLVLEVGAWLKAAKGEGPATQSRTGR
jgi:hypothetical protein